MLTHPRAGESVRYLVSRKSRRRSDVDQPTCTSAWPGKASTNTPSPPPGVHVARRGTSRDAARLVRVIIANHDEQARTAHAIAAGTPDREPLPDRVRWALDRRAKAVATRRNHDQAWCCQANDWAIDRQLSRDQQLSRGRGQSRDYGLERDSLNSCTRLAAALDGMADAWRI